MLKNYITIAFRNLVKNKLYSLINILGLTIGMTCFILIALYIQHEMSYDLHHEKSDQIYRIAQQQKGNDFRGTDLFAVAPITIAPELKKEFPEVEAATTLQVLGSLLKFENKVFFEQGMFCDEFVFDVFRIPVLEGEGQEALMDPNAILLTESLAKKFFGESSAIGKTLIFDNQKPLNVRGVIEDVPENQHFTYDYILSYKNYREYEFDIGRWGSNNYKAYCVLQKGTDPKLIDEKMKAFDKYTKEAYANAPFTARYFLQPLKDIHLKSHVNFELKPTGDIRYIWLFASIAFIILFLASINYMNLATARSTNRSKEVGIRKVLGARKRQVIFQMLGESFILTFFSFLLAMVLVSELLPAYNELFDQKIPFSLLSNGWILISMLATAILVGGMSGLYPALFLSAISPVKAFQGNILKKFGGGFSLRNFLVVGQFATAIVLAISSICIYQQLQFFQNKKLGFNREQILYVTFGKDEVFNKIPTIQNELLTHPNIKKAALGVNLPINTNNQGIIDEWEGNNKEENLAIYRNYVDYHYQDLFEMELLEGRFFSPDFPTDSTQAYVLNESAVKALGWESAVGKSFRGGNVIGVVKDFHFQPFDLAIEPQFLGLIYGQGYYNYANLMIKTDGEKSEQVFAHVQKTMKTMFPDLPLQVRFMDDAYHELYKTETQFGQVFSIFTAIALFIACMGLFGLVSHNTLQRSKEIGIRKVLGASAFNIVELISKDFLKLVLISLIVAVPIAWYIMSKWLQNFVYRIELEWWVFALAGIAAILVAFFTIGIQSTKAALVNPVESLKSE